MLCAKASRIWYVISSPSQASFENSVASEVIIKRYLNKHHNNSKKLYHSTVNSSTRQYFLTQKKNIKVTEIVQRKRWFVILATEAYCDRFNIKVSVATATFFVEDLVSKIVRGAKIKSLMGEPKMSMLYLYLNQIMEKINCGRLILKESWQHFVLYKTPDKAIIHGTRVHKRMAIKTLLACFWKWWWDWTVLEWPRRPNLANCMHWIQTKTVSACVNMQILLVRQESISVTATSKQNWNPSTCPGNFEVIFGQFETKYFKPALNSSKKTVKLKSNQKFPCNSRTRTSWNKTSKMFRKSRASEMTNFLQTPVVLQDETVFFNAVTTSCCT